MTDTVIEMAALNAVPAADAAALLRPSCASERWVDMLVAGRPYRDLAALTATSDATLASAGWADIAQALAAHPRIGDRIDGGATEATWSRREQAGATGADAGLAAGLHADNLEYERRFGHVFLICATGRSAEEMLAALRQRLHNDVHAEHDVVRHELRDIVRLRLARTVR